MSSSGRALRPGLLLLLRLDLLGLFEGGLDDLLLLRLQHARQLGVELRLILGHVMERLLEQTVRLHGVERRLQQALFLELVIVLVLTDSRVEFARLLAEEVEVCSTLVLDVSSLLILFAFPILALPFVLLL